MIRKMRSDLYAELYEVEEKHWWHQHKRKVARQMLKKFQLQPGKVLDIGAGAGKMLEELKQLDWQVFGVDIDQQAQLHCRKRRIDLKIADVSQSLPFKDNYFDAVLALDVLEHIKNDNLALIEIKRVVKPNGIILISVPANNSLFSYWDKMLGHYRRYSKKSLKQLSKRTGLKIIYLSYYFSFLIIPAFLTRMIKKIIKLEKTSDFQTNPLSKLLIPFIKILSKIELLLLKYISLPFGLSLICVASTQKKYQS